jgi:hypothetical protein
MKRRHLANGAGPVEKRKKRVLNDLQATPPRRTVVVRLRRSVHSAPTSTDLIKAVGVSRPSMKGQSAKCLVSQEALPFMTQGDLVWQKN